MSGRARVPVALAVMVVAAALAPRASGAQDARLARRLDPPTRAAVTRLVDSAFAAGLPTEPLVDKALEGASKRASGDRIAAAVRSLSDDLARARALLGADASVNEITAGARALRAGVSPTTLQRFGRERGRRPMGVALAVLGELVARGVPPDTAARAVLALTAGGAGDDELVAYQQGVARGARIGAPPAPLGGLPALESGTDAGQLSNDGRASAAPPPPRAPGQPAPRRPPRP